MFNLKTLLLGTALLSSATLSACATTNTDNDDLEVICQKYCGDKDPDKTPEIFTFMNKAVLADGSVVNVPESNFYVASENGRLVTPRDGDNVQNAEKKNPSISHLKTVGLDRRCFSKIDYFDKIKSLEEIALEPDDVTITFVNFDDMGRLESHDLKDLNAIIDRSHWGVTGNYLEIQEKLSDMDRPDRSNPFNSDELRVRDIRHVPHDKTPFYKEFPVSLNVDKKGHVFFYVLTDEKLTFNRKVPAVITYAPATQNAIETLYTPFIEYPVVPRSPRADKLEVLAFHFKRGGTMTDDMVPDKRGEIDCAYPYDLAVIAEGQKGDMRYTPLLIDPEIRPRGPIGG